ncbi:MAG TPA: twitch domain-containing radical SAM protein [Candidatus Acidoferrum sp.]|nr:twitch domain-containing radical SAM protein [Candidatus Acidoferrum sp.]
MSEPGRELSKTFCIFPWIHLALFPEGSVKLCCVANGQIQHDGGSLSVQHHRLEDIWNSPAMQAVRRDMLAGEKVQPCMDCYHSEARSGESHRTLSNARWAQQLGSHFHELIAESQARNHVLSSLPLYYQLMPGNVCNLKCRMCRPTFSSRIERDDVHRPWTYTLVQPSPASERQNMQVFGPDGGSRLPDGPWYRDDAWIDEVLLRNSHELEALYFTGGEPMLEKQVERILQELIRRGVAPKITLDLNTNCTVLRDSMLSKLRRFKAVNFGLSLDGFGSVLEYIRYPAKWPVICRNIETLVELAGDRARWYIGATPVLQVYNALNIVSLLQFLDGKKIPYHIRPASLPWFLDIGVLPRPARSLAAQRLNAYAADGGLAAEQRTHVLSLVKHIESIEDRGRDHRAWRTLMLFTNDLDASRGQSFREVNAELLGFFTAAGFAWDDQVRSTPADIAGAARPAPSVGIKALAKRVLKKTAHMLVPSVQE